ncbi:mucoidy inhibitor MuiA family protein [Robertkochia aurantiaca]|uniref:mucoidy inhibitor MuiA family protein n=1 Tax=Robertkochia aurantiaca TaxID=2873700 RepID=UPI001CCD02EB|nr:mucoidy inhibitor MuiA family protein [Robertkochia sp. 3YJGBD-33]
MKQFFLCLTVFACFQVLSQNPNEKKVTSEISEVTVFMEGAQITRKKQIELPAGTTHISFVGLSPFIQGKSLQVTADRKIMILSAEHRQNFLDTIERSQNLKKLEKQLDDIIGRIKTQSTHLEIIAEKLGFLKDNRDIGGKNQPVSAADLRTASDYYGNSLTSLKMEELKRQEKLEELQNEKRSVEDQLRALLSNKDFAPGEVNVVVKSDKPVSTKITVSYLVNNAGWYPSYDIRAVDVNEPVTLVYHANVRQDTRVDWKDVKLKFSSANPNTSGTAPELQTWYLDYNSRPPSYERNINEVSGFVRDRNGDPIPGANVVVKGTSIGTQTNFDGFYSLAIPGDDSILSYTFIGMQTKNLPVRSSTQNVVLEEDTQALEEVVVVGYGGRKNNDIARALEGKAAGLILQDEEAVGIPLETVRNQTTVDFKIDMPYSVPSNNQGKTVEMTRYSLPATYRYYAVPKVEREAYLLASISDWEQYDLLAGEANIFFENTYVGKTLLDTRYASEELELSLGRDKNVMVNREKDRDFSDKRFIGSRKEETRRWKITVRNNKPSTINLVVLDQAPISRLDEIKVDIEELSGGQLDESTGIVTWELSLAPSETKELILEYTVTYPKRNTVIVE